MLYNINIIDMPINQLFCKKPDTEILNKLLTCFELKNLQDNKHFTRKNLKDINAVNNVLKIIDKLTEYYIPCKAKKYLSDLDEKKIITILRQIVKCFNYFVFSKEKYIKGEKTISYQIMPVNKKDILRLKKKDGIFFIFFSFVSLSKSNFVSLCLYVQESKCNILIFS